MYSSKLMIDRRRRLATLLDDGLVLLPGNSESPMNYRDNAYPFRQDSTFTYLCGLDHPDLTLVLDLASGEEIVFGDEATIDDVVWTGPLPTLAERCEGVGITDTRPVAQLAEVIGAARTSGRRIHYLPPYRGETTLLLRDLFEASTNRITAGASVDLIKAVVELRSRKSPEEIVEIEKAVDITADMHLAAMRMARPGMLESEIAAEVERVAVAAGGSLSFATILTVHGEILHNHYHGNTLEAGQMVLCDAGAATPTHYTGDMSSTFPVSPRFTTRQKEVYEITVNAHRAAVAALAPGVRNLDVHLQACRAITSGMHDLGLMRGDIDDAVTAGAHALFFPCGVGHMMGLDVHDMENLGEQFVGYGTMPRSTEFGLKSLRLGRELESGFVLTIEPGIYFIPELIDRWRAAGRFADFIVWDKLDQWRDFGGIRNEEDFVITDDGARRLGRHIPLTIDEVEAIRSES